MKNSLFFLILVIFLVSIVSCSNTQKMISHSLVQDLTPFGVCYSKVTPDQVKNYRMVIIEPDHYSKLEIEALKETGTKIIAYITLGETDDNRWYFSLLEERGFEGKNENWGSYYLNLADYETRSILIDRAFPGVMSKGVDGLFLDTIDAVAPYTERFEMEPYMVELIRDLRSKYPSTIIIQNAGLFLLDQTKIYVDAVLIEDIASGYNFDENEYFIKNNEEFEQRVNLILEASLENDLPFFIVDFAASSLATKEIKTRLDKLNKPYFIGDIHLSKLPNDPKKVTNRFRESK